MLQRIGAGVWVVIGMSGLPVARVSGLVHGGPLFQLYLTFTTVAAAGTAVTKMVGARVLGATAANPGGFLTANTTVERHD
jgi:hypothetical protein